MEPKSAVQSAIVIGAGVGGLNLAARLAKAGIHVTIVEKNDHVGGRCSIIEHDGHRFDQGPSLLLMPEFFQEAFEDLGSSLEAEGIELIKCEPNYLVWFHDGHSFQLSSDLARMKPEIEKWEGKDGFLRYLKFLEESHQHYEISGTQVLHRNFTSLLSLLRVNFLFYFFNLHVLESVYTRASRYFKTDRLRRVFTFGSMYMGMSPFDAPGTYSLLQYAELAQGIWYPKGGFFKVPSSLAEMCNRFGVEFRLRQNVSSIDLSHGDQKAKGITLETGQALEADIVVCNADLVYAYNNLLPPSKYAKRLEKKDTSCSSISFYWSMNRVIPELHPHNIFLAEHYQESFDNIFKDQLLPQEPSFYLHVSSRVDPAAAPPDKDSVVVLCPVGHLKNKAEGKGLSAESEDEWNQLVSKARKAILKTVKSQTGVDLSLSITHEAVNTPESWKEKFNLDKGGILGLSHSFFNVLSFRPHTKHDSIEGLYFVGASTHPGTGVPVVLAGGKITSEQILEDHGIAKPWASTKHALSMKTTSSLDCKHSDQGWRNIASLAIITFSVLYIYFIQPYVMTRKS